MNFESEKNTGTENIYQTYIERERKLEIFRSKKGKEMIEEKKMKNIYLLSVKRTRTHLTSSSLPTKLSLSCTFFIAFYY